MSFDLFFYQLFSNVVNFSEYGIDLKAIEDENNIERHEILKSSAYNWLNGGKIVNESIVVPLNQVYVKNVSIKRYYFSFLYDYVDYIKHF